MCVWGGGGGGGGDYFHYFQCTSLSPAATVRDTSHVHSNHCNTPGCYSLTRTEHPNFNSDMHSATRIGSGSIFKAEV